MPNLDKVGLTVRFSTNVEGQSPLPPLYSKSQVQLLTDLKLYEV